MVPESSLPDDNRILMMVFAQYVTNFHHKIVHCLFSMWHKDRQTIYSREQFTSQKNLTFPKILFLIMKILEYRGPVV